MHQVYGVAGFTPELLLGSHVVHGVCLATDGWSFVPPIASLHSPHNTDTLRLVLDIGSTSGAEGSSISSALVVSNKLPLFARTCGFYFSRAHAEWPGGHWKILVQHIQAEHAT